MLAISYRVSYIIVRNLLVSVDMLLIVKREKGEGARREGNDDVNDNMR